MTENVIKLSNPDDPFERDPTDVLIGNQEIDPLEEVLAWSEAQSEECRRNNYRSKFTDPKRLIAGAVEQIHEILDTNAHLLTGDQINEIMARIIPPRGGKEADDTGGPSASC